MISFIKGSLEYIGENYIILENNGIGYRIFVSTAVLSGFSSLGEEVKVYTYMNVKDDGITLFGFYSKEELDLFQKLITVSGIGPKAALNILSSFSPSELVIAILSSDEKTLSRAVGVGKKTVQRLILELKDKLSGYDVMFSKDERVSFENNTNNAKFEAIEALTALGYSRSEAAKAVNTVDAENLGAEGILKAALKKMI